MTPEKRKVSRLPLQDLWTEAGFLDAKRVRDLSADDITILLRRGTVRFVVADIGGPLEWISPSNCYDFWKSEVREHLADPAEKAQSWEYPSGYCYFATEWSDGNTGTIVVLETHH